MIRATRAKGTRRAQEPKKPQHGVSRQLLVVAGLGAVALIAAGALLLQTRGEGRLSLPGTDPGPVHVHGLGVNPADGALYIATHTGLYRVAKDERKAKRVANRYQDTMGFTIVGPNRFLGSGHPDLNEAREKGLPSLLGLIESTDAGESWQNISLSGAADFHVLRSVGDQIYGYDATNDRLLVSADAGRTWRKLQRPGPLVDLAVDPADEQRIVASSIDRLKAGLFESRDEGGSWSRIGDAVGLMAWPGRLYLVGATGKVYVSRNAGRTFERRGEIGGAPAAFLAQGSDELYVALHDGTVKHSMDGGATWAVRSTP